jgi:hypothetical protein
MSSPSLLRASNGSAIGYYGFPGPSRYISSRPQASPIIDIIQINNRTTVI